MPTFFSYCWCLSRKFAALYICVCVCVRLCMRVYMCVCVYIYIYVCVHIYIYIYICIGSLFSFKLVWLNKANLLTYLLILSLIHSSFCISHLLNSFHPEIKELIQKLEWIKDRNTKHVCKFVLSNHTYLYIYIVYRERGGGKLWVRVDLRVIVIKDWLNTP